MFRAVAILNLFLIWSEVRVEVKSSLPYHISIWKAIVPATLEVCSLWHQVLRRSLDGVMLNAVGSELVKWPDHIPRLLQSWLYLTIDNVPLGQTLQGHLG